MPTFLDTAVNIFFTNAGGTDFIGTIFAIPVIVLIVVSLLRTFQT